MTGPAWKGRFVVLEGIDGSGTTTQAALAATGLRRKGFAVLQTQEPSEGPIGTLIRQALKGKLGGPGRAGPPSEQTLALMFAADRLDHLEAEILPALHKGKVVICDRYLLSSLAYQGAACPIDWVEEINAAAAPPDLTIFLDVKTETAARRRASRGASRELFETDERQRKVRRQYAVAIRRREKRDRILQIDGNRPVKDVAAEVQEAVLSELRKVAGVALR
jgi:dTMP kinase